MEQVLSFLKIKKSIFGTTITFPVVIVSPNVLELDNEHLEGILNKLHTWNKTDN